MRTLLRLFVLSFLLSCAPEEIPKEVIVMSPREVQKNVIDLLTRELSKTDTNSRLVVHKDTLYSTPLIAALYKRRDYKPIFSDLGRFNRRFYSLSRVMRDAREFGLIPQHYHWPLIDSLAGTSQSKKDHSYDAMKIADVELLLADAFFVMAHHLNHGRLDPDSLTPRWKKAPIDTVLVQDFEKALESLLFSRVLASYEPTFYQYIDLKAAYRNYKRKMKEVKWSEMPDIKKDTAAYMKMVRKRMIEMGYLDSTKQGNDSLLLSRALVKFQREYHLTEDGKVGKEMVKALAITVEGRIRQLEMNLERWRWERKKTYREEKIFVWINLPGYKFTVSEKDTVAVESKIICGDPKHQSPVPLRSSIQYFTIYPYWNVPYSIASKEILPRIKWDTAYLRKNRFEVINWRNEVVDPKTVNWRKYGEKTLPYKFRQREGEENSLGLVKFFFNNKAGVYLHDTNTKKAFKREVRALSHGCIRLEQYMAFAEFLVRDDSVKIPKDTLHAWFGRPEQRIVQLKRAVPIYLKYFTCEVIKWNQLHFYADIYGKDEKMIAELYKGH